MFPALGKKSCLSRPSAQISPISLSTPLELPQFPHIPYFEMSTFTVSVSELISIIFKINKNEEE